MAYICNPSFALQQWSVTAQAAGAVAASASRAAGAAGVRHVARRVIVSFAANDTVQGGVQVNLRDGATGAGTVISSWSLGSGLITATSRVRSTTIDEDNLHHVGTAATAMTLEFAAAPVANTVSAVTLLGYDISNTN